MTMGRKDARSYKRDVPAFLTQGFRPFFLAAGLWAAMALALWIVMFVTGNAVPSRFDPLTWHIHEMLFGFVMAAIAGFLLTAISPLLARSFYSVLIRSFASICPARCRART
jgi:uncharacterized protein involved in response to NO